MKGRGNAENPRVGIRNINMADASKFCAKPTGNVQEAKDVLKQIC